MQPNLRYSFAAFLLVVAIPAQTASPTVNNPTYSEAILQHRDPLEYLSQMEARMTQEAATLGHPAPYLEALAAKAALEAGQNDKAATYATEALAVATRMDRNRKHPRYPEVQFYANFVFGRLSVLNGDLASAGRYLLAAGQTSGGPVLASHGPNMSLALELLNKGDAQNRQTVLQFIEEIKTFWKISPAPFDMWSAQIRAGKIPNFQAVGPNLYN
jgi:hypothetical protein